MCNLYQLAILLYELVMFAACTSYNVLLYSTDVPLCMLIIEGVQMLVVDKWTNELFDGNSLEISKRYDVLFLVR